MNRRCVFLLSEDAVAVVVVVAAAVEIDDTAIAQRSLKSNAAAHVLFHHS